MCKKILSLLLPAIISSTVLLAQQKITPATIVGKWQITSLIADGKTIPVESESGLKAFMYDETVKRKKGTTLTKSDSSGIEMAVQIFMMLKNSVFTFNANKTYTASVNMMGSEKKATGTWLFNQAKQTVLLTELKNGKPAKSQFKKILVRQNGLLVQMDEKKEEGLVLTKVQ
jgi:hypothetical protein